MDFDPAACPKSCVTQQGLPGFEMDFDANTERKCVEVDSLVLRSLVSIVSLDEDPGSPGSDIMSIRR